jgi:hypothetical protein
VFVRFRRNQKSLTPYGYGTLQYWDGIRQHGPARNVTRCKPIRPALRTPFSMGSVSYISASDAVAKENREKVKVKKKPRIQGSQDRLFTAL